ncbi:unnamed protein product [Orchesella dallaii]|uniref:Eukaryotic translation initiation factor 3 subunit G N-terminal domain-containing protein n=1 Tax=Orchesella dallaii TaxID=48710 RepID=A0ABP1RUD2_9HEXA
MGDLMKVAQELDDVLERRMRYAPPPSFVNNESRLNYTSKFYTDRNSREYRRDRFKKRYHERKFETDRYRSADRRDPSFGHDSYGYRPRSNSYNRGNSQFRSSGRDQDERRDRFQQGDRSSNNFASREYSRDRSYSRDNSSDNNEYRKEVTISAPRDGQRDSSRDTNNRKYGHVSPYPYKRKDRDTRQAPPGILKEDHEKRDESERRDNSQNTRQRSQSASNSRNVSSQSPARVKCHICGGNHYANSCPNKSLNENSPARRQSQTVVVIPNSIKFILLGRDFLDSENIGIHIAQGGYSVGQLASITPFVEYSGSFLNDENSNDSSHVVEERLEAFTLDIETELEDTHIPISVLHTWAKEFEVDEDDQKEMDDNLESLFPEEAEFILVPSHDIT